MYFPTLTHLSNFNVNTVHIHTLDAWLGTRRVAVRKHLDPYAFALDSGTDDEFSLKLFCLSCNPAVNILKTRYILYCPCCEKRHDITTIGSSTLECHECSSQLDLRNLRDDIQIWFELIATPNDMEPKSQLAVKYSTQGVNADPKKSGLTLGTVMKSNDADVQQVFLAWGQRCL